jgi:hypothetical protein
MTSSESLKSNAMDAVPVFFIAKLMSKLSPIWYTFFLLERVASSVSLGFVRALVDDPEPKLVLPLGANWKCWD